MANKELVYLSDVRRAILRFEPEAAYILNGVRKVDAVEVVRCKDCKMWKPGDFYMGDYPDKMERGGSCPIVRFGRMESDFCSFGERREGE
jgi:hypothetical protein